MIQKQDVRLGNWVWRVYAPYGTEQSREYNQIDLDDMKLLCSPGGSFTLHPIPLTPEILEKIGKKYTRTDNNWDYEISVGALKWYFRFSIEWYSEFGGIYIDSKVQHLHQVQNIIFDFTGQELTIKL